MHTIVYLQNRHPARGVKGVTPKEIWSGRKPKVVVSRDVSIDSKSDLNHVISASEIDDGCWFEDVK